MRARGRHGLPGHRRPFILRGVTLAGIESVMCPRAERLEAWPRVGSDLDQRKLDAITTPEVPLSEAIPLAERLLAGEVTGRVVIDVSR